jgi:hypothetical protein
LGWPGGGTPAHTRVTCVPFARNRPTHGSCPPRPRSHLWRMLTIKYEALANRYCPRVYLGDKPHMHTCPSIDTTAWSSNSRFLLESEVEWCLSLLRLYSVREPPRRPYKAAHVLNGYESSSRSILTNSDSSNNRPSLDHAVKR